ncbi:biotin synthase BioB [Helicovermis profundi]|uniref:Biotin synthase n=1 Tax=Helicovermis profundi TaxID=3065157 RepID=A0AAU9ELN6_9FIRM|nr:biotin synthase BioB [Clostridia bacterium S502]
MKNYIENLKENILNGQNITFDQAIRLINIDISDDESLNTLFSCANQIRENFVGNKVDLCTIENVKSGKCSEDCKYCAQSVYYSTGVNEYDLMEYDEILKNVLKIQNKGVNRYSLVTSGRGIIDNIEFDKLLNIYSNLKKDTNINICASHGLATKKQILNLKKAGVSRYHHNIETCKSNYANICSTHTYEDRIITIKNALSVNMDVCCGGILGMGETRQNRVEMAFEIKNLGIKSIPLNVLMPIEGTPFENIRILPPLEILKTMSVYRFINTDAFIRYAGGRIALRDKQTLGLKSGVNGILTGNFLTTSGSNIKEDINMVLREGFVI